MYVGRSARGRHLFRREAIAVVGLSWILATLLGAVPFWLTGTCRSVDTKGHPVRMDLFDGRLPGSAVLAPRSFKTSKIQP